MAALRVQQAQFLQRGQLTVDIGGSPVPVQRGAQVLLGSRLVPELAEHHAEVRAVGQEGFLPPRLLVDAQGGAEVLRRLRESALVEADIAQAVERHRAYMPQFVVAEFEREVEGSLRLGQSALFGQHPADVVPQVGRRLPPSPPARQ